MLTRKQKEILDYIKRYIKENDYAPSLQEIGRKFKLSSSATVHQHISNLKKRGYLEKIKNQPRSIKLKDKRERLSDLIRIPLLGTIAAGQPIEAIEDKEIIEVPENLVSRAGENFALKVQGNSMIDEGIFDGDIVIIRKQQTADNGETVVALINDNEVTLKKIYKEKNGFRLQPANPDLKPIFTKGLQVQGKVISVIRSFDKLKERISKNKEFEDATIKYIENTDIKYRKSLGQYFTPRTIRELLLKKLPKTMKKPKVLDPACGTGEFLITAKNYFDNPELNGWEIDKNLLKISKKLLPKGSFKKIDSLTNKESNKYDFVIGNPPYFEFSPPKLIRKKFEDIINGRINIFSLFIYQGINLLKEGGYLAFVVPPSMNNGAYFSKLRKFIVDNSNIEYLHILKNPKIFHEALQSTMLLILKKGENKGDYLFRNNGLLIFSENAEYLKKEFNNKITLQDLNYRVKTGRFTWNQNKHLLTDKRKGTIPLIWAHNIAQGKLNFPITINKKKPQYVKTNDFDIGPAVVVNRIIGTVKSPNLKAAVIPSKMKFIAENHVNVIYPPSKQIKMDLRTNPLKTNLTIYDIAKQLSSKEKLTVLENITGNTQISKTELENLFPITFK